MSTKPINSLFNWFIRRRMADIEATRRAPVEAQRQAFSMLLQQGKRTRFGVEHGLQDVRNFREFKSRVPVRTYDEFKPWIEAARAGESDVIWPGKISWFAKSSGTTSDRSKFLPVTAEALHSCHYKGGKDLLAMYCAAVPQARLYEGKHLALGGSSALHEDGSGGYTGDLSAIIIRNLPAWVEARRTPGRKIALMDDWTEKVDAMARTTMKEDVRSLSGVPSWMLVIGKRILELSGADSLGEVWPDLQLYMHGGVSFGPYRRNFQELIGASRSPVSFMESYNASEGFFGLQDRIGADDMLLMADYGIHFEFMPREEWEAEEPQTLELRELEVGESYALVISTNAGLWRYALGDVVRITEKFPFRMQVVGRTSMCLNAFGEELMVGQTDLAIRHASDLTSSSIRDYTVAPVFMSTERTGGHEWAIEFDAAPRDLVQFTAELDAALQRLNSDYAAKRTAGLAMSAPRIHIVSSGTFEMWLRARGKVGGQHKVPRLSNQRTTLEAVLALSDFAPRPSAASPEFRTAEVVDKTAGAGRVGFGLQG